MLGHTSQMPTKDAARALAVALESLAVEVENLTYPIQGDSHTHRVARRNRTSWIIREHLIRRLADLEGTVRVVVAGPTGSGASTVINSIAGVKISEAGPLRPTTTVPVVWCEPRLEPEFAFNFLTGFGTGPEATRPLRVVAHRHHVVESLALVDAPDFDSTEVEHRSIAELLVDAADYCLLIVSRHRYADAAVWEFLDHVNERPLKVAAVMNRTEQGDGPAVEDFEARLKAAGLDGSLVAVIEEQPLTDGLVMEDALEPVRAWLEAVVEPTGRQQRVKDGISATLGGLFKHLDALDVARSADLAEGRALRAAAERVADERAAIVVERIPTIQTRQDLAALIEREIGEVRRWTGAAWLGLDGGKALAEQLSELASPDIEAIVSTNAADSDQGDGLTGSVQAMFEQFGRSVAALVEEPAEIDALERAAAVVMQAGRTFLDA